MSAHLSAGLSSSDRQLRGGIGGKSVHVKYCVSPSSLQKPQSQTQQKKTPQPGVTDTHENCSAMHVLTYLRIAEMTKQHSLDLDLCRCRLFCYIVNQQHTSSAYIE